MKVFYSEFSGSGHDAAYRLLAYAFASEYGGTLPEIAKTEFSKPYFPVYPGIHFSLSHTKNMVMAALSSNECGCDIELVRPYRPGLDKYVCTERELNSLEFFSLWTLKESYIKLKGRLTTPLKNIEFFVQNGTISAPEPDILCRTYTLASCRGAVCSRREPPPEKCIHVSACELNKIPVGP